MWGFNLKDFALFYPSGQLGRRLLLKVSDIMLKEYENPVVPVTECVKELITTISKKNAGAVSIIDGKGSLVGLITDFDIRKTIPVKDWWDYE